MELLTISERPVEGVEEGVLLAPAGQMRARGGEAFRAHVDALLERAPTALIIDLGKTESIDSAGVGYLLRVHDALAAQGAPLALAAPSAGVRIVLDSIGLTEFFTVCESVADAEAEIRARTGS
ncbi:MAG: STAS domain-containing protein [Planctomycetes bacterium]|nr:STAS domain-containing protein [Planctomycetota bacterium]